MHPGSPDNEERRLLAEYETATRYYSWAVSELTRTLEYEDYGTLFRLAEDAFEACATDQPVEVGAVLVEVRRLTEHPGHIPACSRCHAEKRTSRPVADDHPGVRRLQKRIGR